MVSVTPIAAASGLSTLKVKFRWGGNVALKARVVLGAGALIHKRGKLLLVKRAEEPDLGFWSFPGGTVEAGETTDQAAVREAKEEVGLDIEIEKLFDVVTYLPTKDGWRKHVQIVIVDYLARPTGTEIRLNEESSEWGWFTPKEIIPLQTTKELKRLAADFARLKL